MERVGLEPATPSLQSLSNATLGPSESPDPHQSVGRGHRSSALPLWLQPSRSQAATAYCFVRKGRYSRFIRVSSARASGSVAHSTQAISMLQMNGLMRATSSSLGL